MSVGDLIGRLTGLLNRASIPYMVVGSFASTFHGQPRTTQDIDVVIDPTPASLREFLRSLPEQDYYVSEEAARDALARRSMFNVIDIATGWKADLIVRGSRPFSSEEFRRRVAVRLLGHEVYVASAEDTVLAKLEWAAAGESERQLRDVASVIAIKGDALDESYIDRWAADLHVLDAWRALRRKG